MPKTDGKKTLAFASGRYTCPSQDLGIIMQSGDSLNWIRPYRQIIKRKPSVNSGVICKKKQKKTRTLQVCFRFYLRSCCKTQTRFLFGRLSPASTCAVEAERQILVRLRSANSVDLNRPRSRTRRRLQGNVAKSAHGQCATGAPRGEGKETCGNLSPDGLR